MTGATFHAATLMSPSRSAGSLTLSNLVTTESVRPGRKHCRRPDPLARPTVRSGVKAVVISNESAAMCQEHTFEPGNNLLLHAESLSATVPLLT